MDFLIVNFQLEGAANEGWEQRATQLAPRFAAMPDLLSKVWLADVASDTSGGAYLWRDRASLDAYLAGSAFAALAEIPGAHSIETRTFAALDAPTLISGTAMFTTTAARATLLRGRLVYATGRARLYQLTLHAHRPVHRGRYTLILHHRDGRRTITTRRTITIA